MFATFYLTGRLSSQVAKQSNCELDGSEIKRDREYLFQNRCCSAPKPFFVIFVYISGMEIYTGEESVIFCVALGVQ